MLIIFVSFILAFVLDIIPLGLGLQAYNPPWVILVLIYWCWYAPKHVGVVSGFMAGLCSDVIKVETLGVNALAATLIAYLACRLQPFCRSLPVWQQTICVWVLILIYKVVISWMRDIFSVVNIDLSYWLSSFVVLLVWPLLVYIMKSFPVVRRGF